MRGDPRGFVGADVSVAAADTDAGTVRSVPVHGDRVDQRDPVLRQDSAIFHAS